MDNVNERVSAIESTQAMMMELMKGMMAKLESMPLLASAMEKKPAVVQPLKPVVEKVVEAKAVDTGLPDNATTEEVAAFIKARAESPNSSPDEKRAYVNLLKGAVAKERVKDDSPEARERRNMEALEKSLAPNKDAELKNGKAVFVKMEVLPTPPKGGKAGTYEAILYSFGDGLKVIATEDIHAGATVVVDGTSVSILKAGASVPTSKMCVALRPIARGAEGQVLKVRSVSKSKMDKWHAAFFQRDGKLEEREHLLLSENPYYGNLHAALANGAIEIWKTYIDRDSGVEMTATFKGRSSIPFTVYVGYLKAMLGVK